MDGASEAAPGVGLRMVSVMRIYGRGRGIRSCSDGWVKDGVDDAELRPWTGRQKLLRWLGSGWCRRCGSAAVDEASEAAPEVGLRVVLTMRICGRGRGVRSCFGRLDEGARKRI